MYFVGFDNNSFSRKKKKSIQVMSQNNKSKNKTQKYREEN